jgi:hypothetical protein
MTEDQRYVLYSAFDLLVQNFTNSKILISEKPIYGHRTHINSLLTANSATFFIGKHWWRPYWKGSRAPKNSGTGSGTRNVSDTGSGTQTFSSARVALKSFTVQRAQERKS